jgi:hypothetical protein
MSNSNLVTYTKLSPNCTKPRNHAIDTITIHCFVGQVTAEQGCNAKGFVKYNPITGSSCNYVVGYDGSIGLCVDEANRSWCSGGTRIVNGISGKKNDHRAITIEVASDTKHPYAVTEKAYNALIELCADICRRNNIKQLLWKGDKSLVGKVDQQNMTVHRWFANKACPGDYLYNKHSDIAAKVNKLLGVKPNVGGTVHVTYKTYTSRWLPEVVDCNDKNADGYAGIHGTNMTALMAKPDKGKLKYRVHLVGKGWLPWVENYTDFAGIRGKAIDAVQMQLQGVAGYEVQYRVSSVASKGWYGWCTGLTDASGDGYAGVFGKPIDCIQVKIVKK